jgi:hypothetical protein
MGVTNRHGLDWMIRFIDHSFTVTHNQNKLQLTINDCLGLVPFWLICLHYCFLKSEIYFTTGGLPPISMSWWQAPWDSRPAFFFDWTLAVIALMYDPLWREDGSLVYNSCCVSPAQSFSGPSPSGFVTTFYCLRFETPQPGGPGPRIYIPPGAG